MDKIEDQNLEHLRATGSVERGSAASIGETITGSSLAAMLKTALIK
jgi:hypothetical protein